MFSLRKLRREASLHLGILPDRPVEPHRLMALIAALHPKEGESGLIRIGGKGDGGYLVPDDVDGICACLSPGVSSECGFDLEIAHRGIDVFMADASVEAPPLAHHRFHFTPHFIDLFEDKDNISFETFTRPVRAKHSEGDWILQMDIEGAEWRVLAGAPDELLHRCRIIVVEFHDLHRLFMSSHFSLMAAVFRKLISTHQVVHIHPNNAGKVYTRGDITIPSVMEFTFQRRDRFKPVLNRLQQRFPNPLDKDCAASRKPVILPEIWWRDVEPR